MSVFRIREAGVEDAELIADMSRRTFFDTYSPYNEAEDMELFMNEMFTKKNLMEEVGAKNNIFLLAYVDERPAGYVRMREFNNPPGLEKFPVMEIARIYVEKEFIGKGVGPALMRRCIAISIDLKKELIWLGVWKKNFRALSFYEKWGFEKFSETVFILGSSVQSDWLMRKKLK
ncbi:MAG: GNAT family N-acetyltransferase [Chitinophagales bacterium]|nr:GNAT family N-acetyltransferase [Chitinophagales bacterium]